MATRKAKRGREGPWTVHHFVKSGGLTFRVHWRVMAEEVVRVDRECRHRGGRWVFDKDWALEDGRPPPPYLVAIVAGVIEEHRRDPGLAMRLAILEHEAETPL